MAVSETSCGGLLFPSSPRECLHRSVGTGSGAWCCLSDSRRLSLWQHVRTCLARHCHISAARTAAQASTGATISAARSWCCTQDYACLPHADGRSKLNSPRVPARRRSMRSV